MTCIFKRSQRQYIRYRIEEFTFISTFSNSIVNSHELLLIEIFAHRNELDIHNITTDCTKTYRRMEWNEESLRFLSQNWIRILHLVLVLECAFIECNATLNGYIDNGFSYHEKCVRIFMKSYIPLVSIFRSIQQVSNVFHEKNWKGVFKKMQ